MNYLTVAKNYFFLLILIGTVELYADEDSHFIIFGNTGFSKDFSPPYLSSYWERGLNMGIGLGVKLSDNIVLLGNAEYHLFKNSKITITNGDGTVYSFLFNLKKSVPYNEKSTFIPYYKAGAGLLKLNTVAVYSSSVNEYTQKEITELVEDEKHRSVFSAAAGMGLDTIINEDTKLFIEFLIVLGFDRPEMITIVPIKLGVSVEL